MSYSKLALYLVPEIALVITAFTVMMVDLNLLRHRPRAERFARLGWLTLAGLAAGGALTLWRMTWKSAALFGSTLVVDPLNNLLAFVILSLTALVVAASLHEEYTPHVGEYYGLLLFTALGLVFMVLAEELLAIFVALELASVGLFALAAFERESRRSAEAAVKYLLYGALATAFLFYGMSLICGFTGQTELRALGAAMTRVMAEGSSSAPLILVGVILLMAGFAYKLAAAPFHAWAPDVYEGAPTAITGYIASGSKVAAMLVLAKILIVSLPGLAGSAMWGEASSGWILVLAALASASMILGNLVALVQTNAKRLLAYSSIAHAGYVLVGLMAFNRFGLVSVLYYMIVYAFTNVGAFAVLQVVARHTGGDDLDHLDGLGRRSPLLSLMMVILILSLAGVPPMGGFAGKFLLFSAAIKADPSSQGLLWVVALAIAASSVSLYYYLIILKRMYISEPEENRPIRLPRSMTAVIGICCLVALYLGIQPSWILTRLGEMVERLF